MDGVAEEPSETHHLIRLVSREAAARLPAVEGGAGQAELSGQSIQREIELINDRLKRLKEMLNEARKTRSGTG